MRVHTHTLTCWETHTVQSTNRFKHIWLRYISTNKETDVDVKQTKWLKTRWENDKQTSLSSGMHAWRPRREKRRYFLLFTHNTLSHTHTKHALFLSLTHTHMIYLSKTWRCDTREKIDLGQGGVWLLCCSPASRGKKVDNSKSWAALLSSNPPSLPSKNTDSHYFGQSPT